MAEMAIADSEQGAPRRLRRDWPRRLLNELVALLFALLLVAAAGLILLDTAPGHRFIVDRVSRLETASGLKIRIGRIEGSIFGRSQLRNVTISDPQGAFLTAPVIKIDWAPGAWLRNALHIDSLTADRATLQSWGRARRGAARPSSSRA